MSARWSPDHLRLHRLLLRRPKLLPQGARLLVAVSGGQDSMALTALLQDLRRLHGWELGLWHGDHRWRPQSREVAAELALWAQGQGLPLEIDGWAAPQLNESAARNWRYGCLARRAQAWRCGHVLTAHTASDRAETLLMHASRGSHRRGLASLGWCRELVPAQAQGQANPNAARICLVRPLLHFSRQDTARICQELALPIWLDPSNDDLTLSRNRIRSQVLPVLEALHPGASQRISALGERIAEEQICTTELVGLALASLRAPTGIALLRRQLTQLAPATQRQLLQHWLESHSGHGLSASQLSELVLRLAPGRGPGQLDLQGGWQLAWNREQLDLAPPGPA
ncbi:tRNA lysidine(34) synthetase TilS [Cyanobium sp. WAJ14-Wanaka]|uniref:tRNA lysidine(34) synthetase TilS n=1 Tax=Cyanobium sp. WAJ14-Wanaka TaxID=2823725 RepID=UPI0020CD3CA6|nr:tRNA lysidine(34) synthetase TilS [Cyanobium sp. WAJ14-Wanaka]MCP9775613.1 tRNA lysidine(34) synthetase TilS [Cyanobium sp. WAJ14-Wanaka]